MANTTFQELIRRVFIGFPYESGEARMAVERAINDALHAIAAVEDFDELIITDLTSADTVDGQKTYNWETDWGLTRPKKIYSIRLMDGTESRKLIWLPPRDLDQVLPYAETLSENKPTHYTTGIGSGNFELIPIPGDAYDLYIRYSQWPATLSLDADVTPYTNLDTVTVFLAKDIANAYLSGSYFDFNERAAGYLSGEMKHELTEPDHMRIAQPFRSEQAPVTGEYWKYPFIRRDP